ncbi:MAG: DUF86 domain-containing protein [Bacteroidales bacterium]|nr:DUF86 domain-containing protein [Bacteroidales bacterium]
MRERARDKGRLQDIVEYSANVTMLIEGFSLEELVADKRTYYSVMKNVEIVGEAAYMLTKDFKMAHPEIPWKTVQGMRHVLVHDYGNVVSETLYDTAKNDIPILRQQVEKYLAETDWNAWERAETTFKESDERIVQSMTDVVRRLKAKGIGNQDIADITGLSIAEIEDI